MGLNELNEKIKSKNITGIYLFYGDEEYTKDFYIKKIKAFCSSAPEYSIIAFDADSVSPALLFDTVNTPSFFSEWKIIELDSFPFNNSPSINSDYADVLNNIPDGVAVMLVYRSGLFDEQLLTKAKDSSDELLNIILKKAVIVNFESQSDAKLSGWIVKHFQSEKTEFENDVPEFIINYCGNDMSTLAGELEKLSSYYTSSPITVEDVKNICCSNAEYKLFDIVNCISERNTSKLKSVYDGLVYAKTAPEIILGTIAGFFVDLLNVKTAFNDKILPNEAKKILGMTDWQFNRASSSAKRFELHFIENAINECKNTDIIIKTHQSDPYVMIEIMLYRIMSYEKRKT